MDESEFTEEMMSFLEVRPADQAEQVDVSMMSHNDPPSVAEPESVLLDETQN